MSKRLLGLAALVLGWSATVARADDLNVGDAPPKLDVKEFVKGEPVTDFQKGKVYVVEFWATWCPPCRTSIPHLTDLQKKNKDVTFIGVSVFEQDQKNVKPFVDEMGDKMDYRVALDNVPAGGDDNSGKMGQSWMAAAGEHSIPTAFIVNGDGKIAWIGHPMKMDQPLEKIVAGKWDLDQAVQERKKAKDEQAKLLQNQGKIQKLALKLNQARQAGDNKALLSTIDEIVELLPQAANSLAPMKMMALAKTGEVDKAVELGRTLLDNEIKDNPDLLNNFAWMIVDPSNKDKADAKLLKLAVEAGKLADELAKEQRPEIADTYAKALFDSGEVQKAVEVQERAVRLAKGTPFEQDADMKKRLEEYREAAKKASDDGK